MRFFKDFEEAPVVIAFSVFFAGWLMSFAPSIFVPVVVQALMLLVLALMATVCGLVGVVILIREFTGDVWKYLRKKRKA
jgi:hypothetical protein